jgi:hypothetical protein
MSISSLALDSLVASYLVQVSIEHSRGLSCFNLRDGATRGI